MSSYPVSPQFKFRIFHMFICITYQTVVVFILQKSFKKCWKLLPASLNNTVLLSRNYGPAEINVLKTNIFPRSEFCSWFFTTFKTVENNSL